MSDKKPIKKGKSTIDEPSDEEQRNQELDNKLTGLEAEMHFFPEYNAAKTMSKIHWGANASAAEKSLIDGLIKCREQVQEGDMSSIETMFMGQMFVLDIVFSQFVIKAVEPGPLEHFKEYTRLALKAQNQCQRTGKTLLEYKNPKRATFIKQQNLGINQQINDGQAPIEIPEKKPANQLLEVNHESRLDTGTAQEASKANTPVEALGEVDRAED